jgi:hypothetical protein
MATATESPSGGSDRVDGRVDGLADALAELLVAAVRTRQAAATGVSVHGNVRGQDDRESASLFDGSRFRDAGVSRTVKSGTRGDGVPPRGGRRPETASWRAMAEALVRPEADRRPAAGAAEHRPLPLFDRLA